MPVRLQMLLAAVLKWTRAVLGCVYSTCYGDGTLGFPVVCHSLAGRDFCVFEHWA